MFEQSVGLSLSKRTSSLRLSLIIVCFIDILVINVGLFPKEINTFGIKMNEIDYSSFLMLMLLLTCFFLSTFWFFANIDWLNYKLLLSSDEAINDWEKRTPNLGANKYNHAIEEFRNSLDKGLGRIEEQIRAMDFIFHLPPEHSFYIHKNKVKKYLKLAKMYQFILPSIEIILPIILGVYSITIILIELI